eukprot:COSAG01_NODE_2641_length_7322_cov_115.896456_3_plen_172_part_00
MHVVFGAQQVSSHTQVHDCCDDIRIEIARTDLSGLLKVGGHHAVIEQLLLSRSIICSPACLYVHVYVGYRAAVRRCGTRGANNVGTTIRTEDGMDRIVWESQSLLRSYHEISDSTMWRLPVLICGAAQLPGTQDVPILVFSNKAEYATPPPPASPRHSSHIYCRQSELSTG